MTQLGAATYYDTAFETALNALRDGDRSECPRLTPQHTRRGQLYQYLRKGGRIH